jgi:cytochrome c-type biogenesis protein CcmF
MLAVWIVASGVLQIRDRLRSAAASGKSGVLQVPRAFWGMQLAHIGIAVFVIGVTLVKGYETEKDVAMAPGDTVQVGGYTARLIGVKGAMGPNYRAAVGDVELSKDGQVLRTLHPEKRAYFSSAMPMTEAAIDTGLLGDLYVSLGEPVSQTGVDGAWGVRIYVKPFIDWIWLGAFLMALGGFIAVADRRYRIAVARRPLPAASAARAA